MRPSSISRRRLLGDLAAGGALAAARDLAKVGRSVVLAEARDRGRVLNHTLSGGAVRAG